MTRECVLKLRFHGPWQAGSGFGDGAVADAIVLKDHLGLPTVPGRTLKGLVREAMLTAAEAGSLPSERVALWLGGPGSGPPVPDGEDDPDRQNEAGRFGSQPGRLWFGSAALPESWSRWVESQSRLRPGVPPEVAALYVLQASTAINGDGVAAEHSLRVTETCVPMELRAKVLGPADDKTWQADLRVCLPLIRALGSRRNRGFGRVRLTLEESE